MDIMILHTSGYIVQLHLKSISIDIFLRPGLGRRAGEILTFITSPRSLQNTFCSSPGRFGPAGEARNCSFVIVIVSIKVLSIRQGPGPRAGPGLGWKYYLLPRPGSARARLARCVNFLTHENKSLASSAGDLR